MRTKSSATCGRHNTSPFVYRSAIRVRPWAIGNGPTTRFLTPTPAMAPQSACHPRTLGTAPAEICLVSPLRHRDPTSQQPALGDPQCRCARGSDAPCGRKSWPQHPVGVGPCGGVAPPRWSGSSRPPCIRRTTTTDHSRAGHRGDSVQFRRCPSPHTPRCPRPFAVSPTRSALLRVRSGSAFGSTHEGGATPPAVENVDPSPVDVCPLRGRRSPLAAVRSWRVDLREAVGARGTSAHAADCDGARSDPRSYGRARPRQGFARFARRGHHGLPRP